MHVKDFALVAELPYTWSNKDVGCCRTSSTYTHTGEKDMGSHKCKKSSNKCCNHEQGHSEMMALFLMDAAQACASSANGTVTQKEGDNHLDADVLTMDSSRFPAESSLVRAAYSCVCHDRIDQYGAAENSFQAIADMWNVVLAPKLGAKLTARDVSLCLIAFKLAREVNKAKTDNLVDLIGYTLLAGRIAHAEAQQKEEPCHD